MTDRQKQMEAANPYVPCDVIHGYIDRHTIWNDGFKKADATPSEDEKRMAAFIKGIQLVGVIVVKELDDIARRILEAE